MTQKPTGVFVRLPLSNEQLGKLLAPIGTLNERMISIGAPVTGGDIPVITTLGTLRDPVPCVRQSDAQAHIAALEAEVVRLREAIHKMIDMSRNAQTWSLNNRSASCRDELSAIGRLGEKTLKGGAA